MTQLAVAILLALAIRTPSPLPQPSAQPPAAELSDAELRQQIDAYLGSIDTPIRPQQWAALGPRATPILGRIVRGDELPTRRAKAIDGLSALNDPGATALFSEVARGENEPVNVRLAAVRGLGSVGSESAAVTELGPVLRGAKDARVRAAAADVLVRRTNGKSCAAVRGQVARETKSNRARFERALSACAAK